MMRIGILGHGFMEWDGGIDFLRMVMLSLHQSGEVVELHVLVPTRGPRLIAKHSLRSAHHFAKSLIGRASGTPPPRPGTGYLSNLARGADQPATVHEIDIGMSAIATTARKLSLDVLIPALIPLDAHFPVPWVGYVADFQHRYLPDLFTAAECAQRDAQFAGMVANATAVIVNSLSVADDIARFHTRMHARVFALPFSAAPQRAWFECGEALASRYGIHRPYFIICNQFWKHKDHASAFEAFAQFAVLHTDVDLVCTGATEDYRVADHFQNLRCMISTRGISDRVHILGRVPKAHQVALLRESIALVQPTLFEGGPGGGAAYDAISLGIRCLISDIEVNRELAEQGVAFFPAGDVSALAQLMSATFHQPSEINQDPEVLIDIGRTRRAACGVQLIAAIQYARGRA